MARRTRAPVFARRLPERPARRAARPLTASISCSAAPQARRTTSGGWSVTRAGRGSAARLARPLGQLPVALRPLPDELWVCDEHAARIAAETVPGPRVRFGQPVPRGCGGGDPRARGAARAARTGALRDRADDHGRRRLTGDPLAWGYDERDALRGSSSGSLAASCGCADTRPNRPRNMRRCWTSSASPRVPGRRSPRTSRGRTRWPAATRWRWSSPSPPAGACLGDPSRRTSLSLPFEEIERLYALRRRAAPRSAGSAERVHAGPLAQERVGAAASAGMSPAKPGAARAARRAGRSCPGRRPRSPFGQRQQAVRVQAGRAQQQARVVGWRDPAA